MKILLSPSKSQDFAKYTPKGFGQKPAFLNETKKLHGVLRKYSSAQIGRLMKISPKLSDLNYSRFQKWDSSFSKDKEFLPALYGFTGDVYTGFTLDDYKKTDLNNADKMIRIISGFYGILKPSDFIKPYRLEMKTKLAGKGYKNLYEFWGSKLTDYLNKELKRNEVVLNLASVEYASSIQKSGIRGQWVDVDFKTDKGGEKKIIAIYAKLVRGEMANWCVINKCKTLDDVKKFNENGWKFSKSDSLVNKLVFIKKI